MSIFRAIELREVMEKIEELNCEGQGSEMVYEESVTDLYG